MRSRLLSLALFGVVGVLMFSGSANAASIGLVPNGGCLPYATTEGTVYFCDRDIRSAGTGVIDPFLQVQRDVENADGTPSTYSSGWNTDATNQDVAATNDMSQAHTEALLASDVGYLIPVGETEQFAVFTVDINQQGAENSLSDIISLNQFELFNCTDNDYTTLAPACTSFFDLFAAGDWVNFDFRNHTGSGAGDIDIYIPADVGFGTEWIALLDGWGCGLPGFLACPATEPTNASTGLFEDNDGFQEWLRTGGSLGPGGGGPGGQELVPEPGSLLLLGTGLAVAAYTARRRRRTN